MVSGSPSSHSYSAKRKPTQTHRPKKEDPLRWSNLKRAGQLLSRAPVPYLNSGAHWLSVLVLSATLPQKTESALGRPGSKDLEPQHRMKRLPVTWHSQGPGLREIQSSPNLETKEMSHASSRMPKKRPSLTEKETEAKSTGRETVMAPCRWGQGAGRRRHNFPGPGRPALIDVLSEDPGELLYFFRRQALIPFSPTIYSLGF